MEECCASASFSNGYNINPCYYIWLFCFTILYGRFALGFDSDPDSCLADPDIDDKHRLSKPPKDSWYDDVGENMRFGFRWLFLLMLLEICGTIANKIYFKIKQER